MTCLYAHVCSVAHNCAHLVQSDARGGTLMPDLAQTLLYMCYPRDPIIMSNRSQNQLYRY